MASGGDGVMGAQKRDMQLRDNQIFVVTLIANQRRRFPSSIVTVVLAAYPSPGRVTFI